MIDSGATYSVRPGQAFEAIIGGMPSETGAFSPSYPPPDLTDLFVQVVPLAGGAPVIARTLASEQLPHSAVYACHLTAPMATGDYSLLWDHSAGAGPFFAQTLQVDTSIPVVPASGSSLTPVYVQQADVIAYLPADTATPDSTPAGDFDKLIVRCELELDSILGFWIRDPLTGRKVNMTNIIPVAPISPFPGELFAPYQRGITPYQKSAIMDATCAQVQYHLEMGEDFFIRPQYLSVSGPQFSRSRTTLPPMISPRTRQHLAGMGLVRMRARQTA